MSKRIILSDSSLNRNGYRVLTEGINLESFKKNPVMLYMHFRDEGSPYWGNYKAIGHWEDIQIDGDQLSAVPVFDKADELSQTVAKKFEAGTFSAASIGILIIETSSDKSVVVQGQTRETVTRCELMETSIVDVPANANSVRLYDRSNFVKLAVGLETNVVPELKKQNMNLKSNWKAVLAFLGIGEDNAETTELSIDQLDKLNAEMARLQQENQTLVQSKKKVDEELSASQTQITTLKNDVTQKDGEIASLKNAAAQKDSEIATFKEQVANLKSQPGSGGNIKPKVEPGAEDTDDFATFCESTEGTDYASFAARMKEEGLI